MADFYFLYNAMFFTFVYVSMFIFNIHKNINFIFK